MYRFHVDLGLAYVFVQATPRLQDSRRVITELADHHLNGNFPEEELQIMAYLAKECLLLNPDDRPTMGEIVQILSTIAPDKSRRRNLPVYLYQVLHICHYVPVTFDLANTGVLLFWLILDTFTNYFKASSTCWKGLACKN